MKFGKKPLLSLSGWFPADLVSIEERPNATLLKATTLDTKERWKETGGHTEKLDSDLWIIGRVKPIALTNQIILKAVLRTM